MPCSRCAADPQPAGLLQPRSCAFESGVFNPDNWQCATMLRLLLTTTHVYHEDDENLTASSCDFGKFFGLLVLQQYKYRGCIQGAIIFNTSAGGHMELTLDLAEKYIQEMGVGSSICPQTRVGDVQDEEP